MGGQPIQCSFFSVSVVAFERGWDILSKIEEKEGSLFLLHSHRDAYFDIEKKKWKKSKRRKNAQKCAILSFYFFKKQMNKWNVDMGPHFSVTSIRHKGKNLFWKFLRNLSRKRSKIAQIWFLHDVQQQKNFLLKKGGLLFNRGSYLTRHCTTVVCKQPFF